MNVRPDTRWLSKTLSAGGGVPLARTDLVELTHALRRVELDAGTVLYGSGAAPEGVWIIESGCVELSEGSGNDRSVVGTLKAGDVVGDVYLLLNVSPVFTARCSDATMAWFLAARDFRRLVASCPSLALAWLCNLATRVEQSRARVMVVLGRSLHQRLARLLLEEAVDDKLRLPQRSIAQMLGAQRTSVNKALKEFEAAGLVTVGYGSVRLRDLPRLRDVAEGSTLTTHEADEPGERTASPSVAEGLAGVAAAVSSGVPF